MGEIIYAIRGNNTGYHPHFPALRTLKKEILKLIPRTHIDEYGRRRADYRETGIQHFSPVNAPYHQHRPFVLLYTKTPSKKLETPAQGDACLGRTWGIAPGVKGPSQQYAGVHYVNQEENLYKTLVLGLTD